MRVRDKRWWVCVYVSECECVCVRMRAFDVCQLTGASPAMRDKDVSPLFLSPLLSLLANPPLADTWAASGCLPRCGQYDSRMCLLTHGHQGPKFLFPPLSRSDVMSWRHPPTMWTGALPVVLMPLVLFCRIPGGSETTTGQTGRALAVFLGVREESRRRGAGSSPFAPGPSRNDEPTRPCSRMMDAPHTTSGYDSLPRMGLATVPLCYDWLI